MPKASTESPPAHRPTRPLVVMGTRPEVIKLAPVILAMNAEPRLRPVVCLTGQHREMVEPLMGYFGLSADIDLDLMAPNQSLASLTGRCLSAVGEVIERHRPDCVVAQGDTVTVLATSLAAFFAKVPFVHVEAGLRTGKLHSPWPEELNRRVAALAGAVHCAPTPRAAAALLDEGVPAPAVHMTGNTVIDALQLAVGRERGRCEHWAGQFPFLGDAPMVLITGHRRENFGEPLRQVCRAIATLAGQFLDAHFVYPVHLNPNVRGPVNDLLGGIGNVHLIPPAGYDAFVWLMDRSSLILTDSGGVQEEAPALGKPVLVLRDTTERPEAVEAGCAELVGADHDRIVARAAALLTGRDSQRRVEQSPYGDGKASGRIVQLILGLPRRESRP